MISLLFSLGFLATVVAAYWSYNDTATAIIFIATGLGISFITSACWYTIAYNTDTKSKILVYSIYWDAMVLGCYMLVPLILTNTQLSRNETLGIALIILGIILTKI